MNLIPSRRKASPAPETAAAVNLRFDGLAMLREIHPEYARLQDRFEALIAREDEILDELGEPGELMRRYSSEVERIQRAITASQPPPPPRQHHPAAVALLADLMTPEPPPPPPSPFAEQRPYEKIADRLTAELDATREAIRLLRPKLEAAHLTASRILCERLTPEYRAVARRYIDAVIALGTAMQDYTAFTGSLRNVAWSCLRPIATTAALGKPEDRSSEFYRLIEMALETGHIDPAAVPSNWKVRRNG